MARVGFRLLSSVQNFLTCRSLTTASRTQWKNVIFPLPLDCSTKSVVATEAASQMKSVIWNKPYNFRTSWTPDLNGKMVPTIRNIGNCKINDEPLRIFNIQCPDIIPLLEIETPPFKPPLEKQAARLIVIRRRKMKKHKLRKLRKKMKFEWAKVRQRREMRKEKAFQAKLVQQIKEAEKFSAEEYVTLKLKQAYEPDIPQTFNPKIRPTQN